MMDPRIFITGVSGYIGGQALASIIAKHPEYSLFGLVRNNEQGQKLTAKFPTLHLVIGDLNSEEVLREQSKQANVVLHTADADHLGAINSIIRGLAEGGKKGYYIHLSGAASVADISNGYGKPATRIWDDVADFDEISTFDETHFHAASDQLVLGEGKRTAVKTVIIEPPFVYGHSDGIKLRSVGIPMLVDVATKRGNIFTIGEGKHIVSSIHVKDLADAFVLFTEQALTPNGGKVEWGAKGIYFAEAQSNVFSDVVDVLAKTGYEKGIFKSAEVDAISVDEAVALHPYGGIMWGMNMRIYANRLRRLGWTPKQPGVIEVVSDLLN